jgi:ribonuclease P protein component
VAFAIGRATGSAVQRNRLRRRLREILRRHDLPPGLYLFGAHARACERTFVELDQTVDRLLTTVRSRTSDTSTPRSSIP